MLARAGGRAQQQHFIVPDRNHSTKVAGPAGFNSATLILSQSIMLYIPALVLFVQPSGLASLQYPVHALSAFLV